MSPWSAPPRRSSRRRARRERDGGPRSDDRRLGRDERLGARRPGRCAPDHQARLAAAALLLVGRLAGLSWTQLGLGAGTLVRGGRLGRGGRGGGVALVYAGGGGPAGHAPALPDTRYQVGPGARGLASPSLTIPLGDRGLRGGRLPQRAVGAARGRAAGRRRRPRSPRCCSGSGTCCRPSKLEPGRTRPADPAGPGWRPAVAGPSPSRLWPA